MAQFTLRSLRDSEEVGIDGVTYALHSKGGPQRPVEAYTLSHEGARVVRASRSSAPGQSFEVQFDDRIVKLARRGRCCDLLARGQRIGTISRRHVLARRAALSVPADWSMPVVVFIAILAALLRDRPPPSESGPGIVDDVIDLFD